MKITSFVAVFTISALSISAQSSTLDSLNRLIVKAKTDTGRINLLSEKISLLIEIDLDSAVIIGPQVVEEARKINFKSGEAWAMINLSSAYCFKGEYAAARQMLDDAGKIFLSLKDTAGQGQLYANLGMMYGMESKYDSALLYYKKAIHVAEIRNDKKTLNNAYQNMAISYMMQSDHTNSILYFQKALDYSEQIKDQKSQAYINLNLGLAYNNLGDSVRGERSILKAIVLSKSLGLKNVELYAYSNLASFYDDKEKYQNSYDYAMRAANLGRQTGDDGIAAASLAKASTALMHLNRNAEAMTLAQQAVRLADSSKQPLNIYQAYSTMGSNLKAQRKYTQAIGYFEKAFHSLPKADLYEKSVAFSYADLSECYEKSGNYSKALEAHKISKQINDSIRSNENVRKATELSMNYEFEKKRQAAVAEQEKKNAITRTRQIVLLTGLAFTFILAVVAFYAFRNKQKTNVLLRRQKTQIEHTLSELKNTQAQLIQSEKMASLGELTAGIAHEIQNPLNFVNNFSEVNKELLSELKDEAEKGNIVQVKAIADNVIENQDKINRHGNRADAIVKGMLQHSRASTVQKELTDINALTDEYLRLAYHGFRAKGNTFNPKLETDFDPSVGKMHIIPQDLGRVILNLLNNAFYAVNEKKKTADESYQPIVSVQTRKLNDKIEVRVTDNGNGIPQKVLDKIFQPFFTTKPTGQGTGLGLSLAYDIVKAHGGEIKVNTNENEGTEFTIVLPV
jgi:two-component system, NtrC family, sensor kinase